MTPSSVTLEAQFSNYSPTSPGKAHYMTDFCSCRWCDCLRNTTTSCCIFTNSRIN